MLPVASFITMDVSFVITDVVGFIVAGAVCVIRTTPPRIMAKPIAATASTAPFGVKCSGVPGYFRPDPRAFEIICCNRSDDSVLDYSVSPRLQLVRAMFDRSGRRRI
jgi:hypothetical protein